MRLNRLFVAILSTSIVCNLSYGQASFTIKNGSDHCIDENIIFENSSSSGTFQWNLCANDLATSPQTNQLGVLASANRPFGYKLVENNGSYYGFMTSSDGTNKLTRLDFGNDPTTLPIATTELNDPLNPSSVLIFPEAIDVIEVGGAWYGIIVTFGDAMTQGIVLVEFGSNIENSNPTFSYLGDFGFSTIRGISLAYDGSNIILALADQTQTISLVNFRDSFSNSIAPGDIITTGVLTNASTIFSLDVLKKFNNWYVFTASQDYINVVSFGNTLFQSPIEIRDYFFDDINSLSFDIDAINEGDSTYVIVSDLDNSAVPIMFSFGDLDLSDTPSQLSAVFPNLSELNIIFDDGRYLVSGIDLNERNLTKLIFEADCGQSIGFTDAVNPPTVTYGSSEGYVVVLDEIVNGEIASSHSENITISSDVAPSISFTIDASRCISNTNTFTPSNTGLTSYNWDFNGDDVVDVSDATGANQIFDYSGLGAGTYTARLEVSDGTCSNFFEQEITIYDPPPAPSYTFSSPRTCVNTDYTFTNTTVDGAYTGPLEYLWEFIDEPSGMVAATADTKDAVYAFTTAGQKTVRLTSSIPGCSEVTEQTIMITSGPTANFFAASVCQDEAMNFTNTSTDAISYSWNFGDGFMSTATNPSHIFNGAGNFFVTLTATDAEGCEDTEVIEVAVSNSPQISFDFNVPCTSADGTQFSDLTTVDNADLVSWTWFVDDVQVSTQQSPQIVFTSTGIKNIRLDVQSSNGCESSYSEDIEVLDSPTPDFNVNLGCQGEVSAFTDNTTSAGNPIVSWLWTVDGVNYGTQDINHVFANAGTFDVTLEVTGQNFCSETITKSVEVIALPEVNFLVDGECDNQIIQATDMSTASTDPVVSRRWMLDGSNVGNGSQLLLSNLADNTYELTLELETQAGCVISSSQTLQINDAPESSFTSSRTYGVPQDRLTFTNTSTGGISYQWLLDGEVRSTDPNSESITFATTGRYNVSLVTQNSLGCNDTTTQEILIAVPEVDLAIGSFELVRENNTGKIFLEIQNFSNLPIEVTEAEITLENTFTISEQILQFIDVGGTSLVGLNVGIPLTVSEPSYFCVKLSSQYTQYDDINPINDEKCITIDPIIQLEDPYPNPVSDQFRLKLIVNESSTASITLINSAGKTHIKQLRSVSAGLNNFFIDMSTYDPGIYHVIVETLGVTHKRKIIKL